jgi:Zn-dependent metalloprotease
MCAREFADTPLTGPRYRPTAMKRKPKATRGDVRRANFSTRGSSRRITAALISVLAGLLFSSCSSGSSFADNRGGFGAGRTQREEAESLPTLPSVAYSASVGNEVQLKRLRELDAAVRSLRKASTSGWQARQDDTTGVAAQLSGGTIRYPSGTKPDVAARTFLDRFGAVFGLGGPVGIAMPAALPSDENHIATLRSVQTYNGVPVDRSSLLLVVRNADAAPEVSFVQGHVFPDLSLTTEPSLDAEQAKFNAGASLATVVSDPILVVATETPQPTLAWRIDGIAQGGDVEGRSPAAGTAVTVFVDAASGVIVEVRSSGITSITKAAADADGPTARTTQELALPPPGTPIQIEATVVGGRKVRINAERLADGRIVFIDSTQPGADRASGRGLSVVYNAPADDSEPKASLLAGYPGTVADAGPSAIDTDAATAAWASKIILDYYRTEHSRLSFDGASAPLVSSVHSPLPLAECNAFFAGNAGQMVYGDPCVEKGRQTTLSMVDIGIVAHEITHGVTGASAPGINQSGQGGALNEGMSDYFGMIIQNQTLGTAGGTLGTTVCQGKQGRLCTPFRDGSVGTRNIDSGAIFDDYEFFLREPFGLLDEIFDSGGIHGNSIVWTNALWKIRKRIAAGDGGDLVNSKAAKRFDRIVYRALTVYFTNSTDMAAAAAAVYQASLDLADVTPQERQIIVDQFIASQLCQGCGLPAEVRYQPIAVSSHVKHRPYVANGGVVYTEFVGEPGLGSFGVATMFAPNGSSPARQVSPRGWLAVNAAAAGSYSVETVVQTTSKKGAVLLTDLASGRSSTLDTPNTVSSATPAISRSSVLWAAFDDKTWTLNARRFSGGPKVVITVPNPPAHLAIDGDLAAVELYDGSVLTWDLATEELKTVFSAPPPPSDYLAAPGGLIISGRNIFLLAPLADRDSPFWQVVQISEGSAEVLSSSAFPAGLTADGDVVVWSEFTGVTRTGVAGVLGQVAVDSDLVAYNIRSKNYGLIVRERGQQGFANLRADRLVWQDSLAGADDIYGLQLDTAF